MRDNDPFVNLLREAVPPVAVSPPGRDLWSATRARLDRPPTWSRMDVGLLLALASLLFLFPQRFLLLAYFM